MPIDTYGDFLYGLFEESTCRGVHMGSRLVAYHFLERDFALGFSNKIPISTI